MGRSEPDSNSDRHWTLIPRPTNGWPDDEGMIFKSELQDSSGHHGKNYLEKFYGSMESPLDLSFQANQMPPGNSLSDHGRGDQRPAAALTDLCENPQ